MVVQNTARKLARSQRFSAVYLIIGLACLLIDILNPGNFMLGHRGILLFIGLIYFAHAFFGMVYYPKKYSRVLLRKGLAEDDGPVLGDMSAARGLIATIATIIFAWDLCGAAYLYLYLIFLLLNIVLWKLTKTNGLFERRFIMVDREVLFNQPDLKPKYHNLAYYIPIDKDNNGWFIGVIQRYVEEYKISQKVDSIRAKQQAEEEASASAASLRFRESAGIKD